MLTHDPDIVQNYRRFTWDLYQRNVKRLDKYERSKADTFNIFLTLSSIEISSIEISLWSMTIPRYFTWSENSKSLFQIWKA